MQSIHVFLLHSNEIKQCRGIWQLPVPNRITLQVLWDHWCLEFKTSDQMGVTSNRNLTREQLRGILHNLSSPQSLPLVIWSPYQDLWVLEHKYSENTQSIIRFSGESTELASAKYSQSAHLEPEGPQLSPPHLGTQAPCKAPSGSKLCLELMPEQSLLPLVLCQWTWFRCLAFSVKRKYEVGLRFQSSIFHC